VGGFAATRLLGNAGLNPVWGNGSLSLVSVVRCQVEVSARGRSLDKRRHTNCGVSECNRESSIMWRQWTANGSCAMEGKKFFHIH
jgi:hypothetical protein